MRKLYSLLLLLLCLSSVNAQYERKAKWRFVFYNCENYFDCFDDSLKNDEEFLPSGGRRWNWTKFEKKTWNIYKTLSAAGAWDLPEMIGLCEIENMFVLLRLINNTPFLRYPYKIIHRESPDRRGIDVAFLFRSDIFQLEQTSFININDGKIDSLKTREILYVKLSKKKSKDSLHVFVNHWPSRWGGLLSSEPKRLMAARALRSKIDSIQKDNAGAKIVVCGDLNDMPYNKSVKEILKTDALAFSETDLLNLAALHYNKTGQATHKYKAEWSVLDHIIVSKSLLDAKRNLRSREKYFAVFAPEFLLEEDNVFGGFKPFRSFKGFSYQEGFSDHLPVYLDLNW